MPGDAMRYAQYIDAVAVEVGNNLAVQFVGGTGVELEVARRRRNVGPPGGEWLASVA